MTHSDTIIKIAPALLAAQKAIGGVKKDNKATIPTKSGGQFNYTYADLGAVIDECKSKLNENGILVLQPVTGETVTTTLIHESGEWITDGGVKIINAKPDDPRAQGSAITYARRYGLQSMVFIPAEDDDAEQATDHKTITPKPTYTNPAPSMHTEDGNIPERQLDEEDAPAQGTPADWCPIHKKTMKYRENLHRYDHRWKVGDTWNQCTGVVENDTPPEFNDGGY